MVGNHETHNEPTLRDRRENRGRDFIISAIITILLMSVLISCGSGEAYAYVEPKTTTVTFLMNGGKDDDVTITVPVGLTFGQILNKMKDEEAPERDGYVFTGWYFDDSGETMIPKTVTVKKDAKAYAGWKLDAELGVLLTIRFCGGHIKNTNISEASVSVKAGTSLKAAIYEMQAECDAKYGSHTVVKKGHTAKKGFYTAKKKGSRLLPDTLIKGDAVAYVQWKKKDQKKNKKFGNKEDPLPAAPAPSATDSSITATETETSESAVSTDSAITGSSIPDCNAYTSRAAVEQETKRESSGSSVPLGAADIIVMIAAAAGAVMLIAAKKASKRKSS